MNARVLLIRCGCAGVLTAVATGVMADALPRNTLSVKITPQMIQQASIAATTLPHTSPPTSPLAKDEPYLAGKAFQAHEVFRHPPQNVDQLPNGCTQKSASLCFDYRSGHTVYKPMRQLLPGIPGMTPHNLSIRRGRIVAQYTFK